MTIRDNWKISDWAPLYALVIAIAGVVAVAGTIVFVLRLVLPS
jgi:hypothetical protein